MTVFVSKVLLAVFVVCGLTDELQAQLVVNPPIPITHVLNVNIIQVAADDGSNAAPLFGTSGQQAAIFSLVDQIWAQAGIDVQFFFTVGTFNNSMVLLGDVSLAQSFTLAGNAGFLSPNRLDLMMIREIQAFGGGPFADNEAAGFARVDGDGVLMWAGPSLPTFGGGREVIASVLAHELGHNLGLPHPSTLTDGMGVSFDQNLMIGSGSPGVLTDGERLIASQIAIALASPLLTPVAVPEPSTVGLCGMGLVAVIFWVHRSRSFVLPVRKQSCFKRHFSSNSSTVRRSGWPRRLPKWWSCRRARRAPSASGWST